MSDKVQASTIYLKDYQAPYFTINQTQLCFTLAETETLVDATLHMQRNRASHPGHQGALRLDGQELELLEVYLGDVRLAASEYSQDENSLTIHQVPDEFVLKTRVKIKPQENTALEGLYKSSSMFCTQCEAEGFRRITYYLDRPDVMSVFETSIVADKSLYPVLLSNGNLTNTQTLPDGRHMATWHDPFKKPCYLFALVAGNLLHIRDSFTTMGGREVDLRIYVEPQNITKCDYAMDSLKRAMRWDEEVYGREYDLDIFNIVAVDDFNMGAMENKSLNIFNSSCVLADSKSATDTAFQRIEAVVAHEYFHNWSGNRVTCRDWFQLSLKEGFTVFRDAEFSADMGSRTVKRVEDVNVLRTVQFAEDAGPMAHPIRPESFIEISNFYTVTIYEKGAEIIRMIHSILGADNFRKGSDLYFARHDGQAVTTDDFLAAMQDASGIDLSIFRRWYQQAGTPQVEVTDAYDAATQTYHLTLTQTCPPTPECAEKKPFHIPVALGLLGSDGQDMPLQLISGQGFDAASSLLNLTAQTQTFVFGGITEKPVPSLLRGFSAPVKMHYAFTDAQLLFLMAKDSDGFNRWDAAQQLYCRNLLAMAEQHAAGKTLQFNDALLGVFRGFLADTQADKAMLANMLTLPGIAYLSELQSPINTSALFAAREYARAKIAQALKQELLQTYAREQTAAVYAPTAAQMAQRELKNTCLGYLACLPGADIAGLIQTQFDRADNMTDQFAALSCAVNGHDQQVRENCLQRFYIQWQHDPLVVNQWFAVQSSSQQAGSLAQIRALLAHPAFDLRNPNKVRAVLANFAAQNHCHFHQTDGSGYELLADYILQLDERNPQIAARLLGPLTKWKRYTLQQSALMQKALERIANKDKLSKDVFEVVNKSLLH